jgi:putative colanic acid biosynthesis acetyltransferase WcaF
MRRDGMNAEALQPSSAGTPAPVRIDLSRAASPFSWRQRFARALWGATWAILFRPSPRVCHGWRRWLLRGFGARVGRGARVYPSARIWAPWQLELGDFSCLGPDVDCYCVAPIRLGAHAVVSQYSYLCAAGHDITQPDLPLITAPIVIEAGAWVAADVFVGMGVTIGAGAVVGARASVFKDVPAWTVVVGNPARFLKPRILQGS